MGVRRSRPRSTPRSIAGAEGARHRPAAVIRRVAVDLRRGTWTDEEVVYARKIVDYRVGPPASLNGRTLNQILQEALNCDMLACQRR